eukprot:CAMPEP_0174851638 /NCGR_PEP_ID=MMETSP1114-20130205/23298_1 /TAXON_ID=312471 /ORGANISM="Neobodo designis, Strain CCAP 1951/1" /LENGTH=32 /DNA_ID= /DNA_START= /DNA_END= /DNA_ORIENTATION=
MTPRTIASASRGSGACDRGEPPARVLRRGGRV